MSSPFTNYQHQFADHSSVNLPVGKAVCIARNYLAHINELGNEVPDAPVFFMKPSTGFQDINEKISIPFWSEGMHHEVELALLVGETISSTSAEEIEKKIAGYAISLDLTLRDVQKVQKEKGLPWEIAKSFDGSCPISPFVKPKELSNPLDCMLQLDVNDTIRQKDSTKLMMRPLWEMISYMSERFTLLPGDVILSGTPEGVGKLEHGDKLKLTLDEKWTYQTEVQ